MKEIKVKTNKQVYLGLSILEISKRLMYEFWYDYIKRKYQNNVKLCYMDTDSFIIHIKTVDFYKDIANDVEKRCDKSNCSGDDKIPLPRGINKKVFGLFKDELGGRILKDLLHLDQKYILT